MTVGQRIRALRQSKGMTQEELATKVNTIKQTIYKYESGVITNIPFERLQNIADALGTTPSYLMGWEDNAPNASATKSNTTPADYGSRIIKARRSHGVTQKELAGATGFSMATIYQYESGTKTPDIVSLRKIAGAIGCSVVDLIPMNISVLESVEPLLTEDEKKEIKNRIAVQVAQISRDTNAVNNAIKETTQAVQDIISETIRSTLATLNDNGWKKVQEYIADIAQNPKYQKKDED